MERGGAGLRGAVGDLKRGGGAAVLGIGADVPDPVGDGDRFARAAGLCGTGRDRRTGGEHLFARARLPAATAAQSAALDLLRAAADRGAWRGVDRLLRLSAGHGTGLRGDEPRDARPVHCGRLLLVLALLKILATTISFSSGTPGGMFAPTLFIGAMLGASIGTFEKMHFPNLHITVGAYALVGMGVLFAAFLRVPLTSVFMVLEVSGNYSIILPVILANTIAYLVSRSLQPTCHLRSLHASGWAGPAFDGGAARRGGAASGGRAASAGCAGD